MDILPYKMPKKAIDYSNTVIYKIVCNDVNITEIYVCHTTNFVKRKATHRCAYFSSNHIARDCYVYQYIREHGGFDNWSMIEVEKYPCNDKYEACSRERYWLEFLHATLNKQIPNRTRKEYLDDNKETISERQKRYQGLNRATIIEYKKQYYKLHKRRLSAERKTKFNCDCGGRYTLLNKCQHNKSIKHQNYINSTQEYEYQWLDGTPCSEQDYYDSL